MSFSNYPRGFANGVTIRDVPLIITNPGKVFWVNNSTALADGGIGGSDNGPGTYQKPFRTIDAAIGKCTASRGDTIMVMPGYTQTISAAVGIDLDVVGVTIIGLGNGTLRPTITFDTAVTADIDIDAANTAMMNFRFIGNIAALAAPIDVNAAGFTMQNCDFYANAATTDVDISIITDAAADDMWIEGCGFYYLDSLADTAVTAVSTEVIRLVGADRAVIKNNFMIGDFTTSAINGITTASKALRITGNEIHNVATEDIAGAVDLVAACDGVIANNFGSVLFSTNIATLIDPSSCSMIENYFSNVVTETGGLIGTASA